MKNTSSFFLQPAWIARRSRLLQIVFLLAICFPSAMHAQIQEAPAEHLPAEKIFIGNAGAVGDIQGPQAAQHAARAYNAFFLSLRQWGRYEIVADPARADWILETSIASREICHTRREQREGKPRIEYTYRVNVLMMNARTKVLRARLSEVVGTPAWYSSFDKLFDQTIVDLMDSLKKEVAGFADKTPRVPHNEPMSPLPPRISLAQKIYIHNRGVTDDPGDRYGGGGAQLYDQFAAQLKNWGRYQIVPEADADLIFDISFSASPACTGLAHPQLELYIRDAGTDAALWAFSNEFDNALLASNARKNFARAIVSLVADIRGVAETPTWAVNATVSASQAPVVAQISASRFSSANPVPAKITLPSTAVKSGSKLAATVIVNNTSKQSLEFAYPKDDPLSCVLSVQDANGKDVKETQEGAGMREAHAAWQGPPATYVLRPGEKQTRECPVSSLFDISNPGKYSITVRELDGRPAVSNVATITILP